MTSSTPTHGEHSLTYAGAGVDIDAGDRLVKAIGPMAARTRIPGVMGALGGFGALFDLKAAGFMDPVLVSGTDGVGTKLKIAIETGQHDTIGIDLVAMCVNDVLAQGAKPLFFLDYFATGRLDTGVAARVIEGVARGCELAGCALTGGETAEMPDMYEDGHYDLAGFVVGAAERDALLPNHTQMEAGDILLGIGASGPHSNGYSLIRKIKDRSGLAWDAPAPWNPSQSLAEALLTPTAIYTRTGYDAIKLGGLSGLAHITGGGITENTPRMCPDHLVPSVDTAAWKRPAVFGWLQEVGRVDEREMQRTFNCGVGLVLAIKPSAADAQLRHWRAAGYDTFVCGELKAR